MKGVGFSQSTHFFFQPICCFCDKIKLSVDFIGEEKRKAEGNGFCDAMVKLWLLCFSFYPSSVPPSPSIFSRSVNFPLQLSIPLIFIFLTLITSIPISFPAYHWNRFQTAPRNQRITVLCGADHRSSSLGSERKRSLLPFIVALPIFIFWIFSFFI